MSEEIEQNDLTLIQSELNAPKNQHNAFGNYSYRNVEDIQNALKPLLVNFGCKMSISDNIEFIGDRVYLVATVTFIDSNGDITTNKSFAREGENRKGMTSEQLTGSASSYARKYALGGLFLIDDQKDPDSTDNSDQGNAPQSGSQKSQTSQQQAAQCPNEYLKPEYIDKNWNGKLYKNNVIYFSNTKYFVTQEWADWFKKHSKYKPQQK